MDTSHRCKFLRQSYNELKALKSDFDFKVLEAVKNGDLTQVHESKLRLEKKRHLLQEKAWPFKELSRKEIESQYENQKAILKKVGVLKILSNKEWGIDGIDGEEYPFPTYREIIKSMQFDRKRLIPETEYGFSHLLIVPFGMGLSDLIEKYKQVLWRHYRQKSLFASPEDSKRIFPEYPSKVSNFSKNLPFEKNTIIEIDSGERKYEDVWKSNGDVYDLSGNSGLYVSETYKEADKNKDIIYFPRKFDKVNHQGRTKQDVLEDQGGYQILLLPDRRGISINGRNRKIASGTSTRKRKEIEPGQIAEKFLEIINNDPAYREETGITPEDWLTFAIINLEKNNQVIDNKHGIIGDSWLLASYFISTDHALIAYWARHFNQSWIHQERYNAGSSERNRPQCAVRIKLSK